MRTGERARNTRVLDELATVVRFPSVSADRTHAGAIRQCATWLADHLRSIGLEHASGLPTKGHPVVYAEWRHAPDKPTVLIYGHYDVQPAEQLAEWRTPPFTPVVRGDGLYGRGASDDKGQLFIHLKSLESLLETRGRLPVNVICLFEGEEEIGSPNLGAFLSRHRNFMNADMVLISDTQIPAADRPAITYSLRGALGIELEMLGPQRDLHSGVFGGAIANPLQALVEIVASLHDKDGRITIPGFYDRVRRCTARERAYMRQVGPSAAEILQGAGTPTSGERGYSLYERSTIRPSLSVTSITGGYQGPGLKAVIPARAVAKLDIRLVPDQEPENVAALLRSHLASVTPVGFRVRMRPRLAARPVSLRRNHPAVGAAVRAYRSTFGIAPVFIRSGGTIPVVQVFQDILGVPVVMMGFGLPDDHIHGPNERLHLPTFFRGIETSKRFFDEVSRMTGLARRSPPIAGLYERDRHGHRALG